MRKPRRGRDDRETRLDGKNKKFAFIVGVAELLNENPGDAAFESALILFDDGSDVRCCFGKVDCEFQDVKEWKLRKTYRPVSSGSASMSKDVDTKFHVKIN